MRYIKSFKIFEAVDEMSVDDIKSVKPDDKLGNDNKNINLDVLNTIKSDISEYEQKKSAIDNIFNNNEYDEEKINSELLSKVYNSNKNKNKYLSAYESISRLKRQVDRISTSIIDDKLRSTDIKNQISSLKSSLIDANSVQKENINDYFNKINTNINDNKRKLALLEKDYVEKKKNFDNQMKIEADRIRNLSTNI